MRLGTSKPCLPTCSCHTDNEAIGQTEHGKRKIGTSTLVPMIQERYGKATGIAKHARDAITDYFCSNERDVPWQWKMIYDLPVNMVDLATMKSFKNRSDSQ